MKGITSLVVIIACVISGVATAEIERRTSLEEVIVTAQKRPQLLQDTAIAMSVLKSEQLELQGISSLGDMGGGAIASLRMFASGNTPSNLIVGIRGNGTGDPSEITRDGAVAVYLDGVYMARSQGLALELSELERIEVLRGPQGVLFGRNSIGGAVSLVTKKPTGQFGIKQALTMGRFNEIKSVTRINLPEMFGVKAKLDYQHSERDGWVNNTAPGEADFSEYKKDGGKLSLSWQINDQFDVSYSYDHSVMDTVQRYFQFYKDNIGVFGEERQRLNETRLPVTPLDPTNSEQKGHSLVATWDYSDISIKSITAHRSLNVDANTNYAGVLYFNGLNDASVIDQNQFSQELQLVGGNNRFEWVAGLYYLDEDVSKNLQDSFTLDIFGVFGPALSAIDPPTTFDALGSGDFLPPRIVDAEARSTAVYGQFSWNPDILENRLELTIGTRYTEDKKSAARFEFDLSESSQKSDHLGGSIALHYRWLDDFSTYLKWGTAYKAGGVNSRSVSFTPFAEEIVSTWELGLKSEFWDHRARLNVAIFATDYKDIHLDFQDPLNALIVETINGANKAEVDGLELDLAMNPIAGLVVSLSYSYLDSFMPLQPNPLDNGALISFALPLAPKHAGALALDYSFLPKDYGQLNLHFDITSTDHYSFLPYGEQRTDAYSLLNTRVELSDINIGAGPGSLKASVWVKNLLDEEYIILAVGIGDPTASIGQVFGDPRTMGLDISYEF